jgi:hypothetical protein
MFQTSDENSVNMVAMARAADSFNSKASSNWILYELYQYGPTKESSTGN